MCEHVPIRRALISVSDKRGVAQLARRLHDRGVELISTGGTAEELRNAGVPVTAVERLTGFAEMLAGRVKTLHPAVHAALLARRDVESDRRSLANHGIAPIDLVCVNLYPFEEAAGRTDLSEGEVIEQIDIGGPALLRAAAKNHRFVAAVGALQQYEALLEELDAHGGATTLAFRRALAAEAFRRTAAYDAAVAAWAGGAAPEDRLTLRYAAGRALRYGENPHQAAWLYVDPADRGPAIPSARLLHGRPLSYNNIQDAAAALELVQDLHAGAPHRAAATVVKHANPCGAAVADETGAALEAACAGDPLAAYGGIVASSRRIDGAAAAGLARADRFFEVVVAPAFDGAAVDALRARSSNLRLLETGPTEPPRPGTMSYRSVPGGMLAQQRDVTEEDPRRWRHAAGPAPDDALLDDAALAWIVVKHLKSNAVAVVASGGMIGGGCGAVDRVTACRTAVEKAGERARSGRPVAASDAFFPFPDGPQVLIDAGVACIVQPGGSRRDEDTLELCRRRDVTCLLTGVRHFRH